MQDTGTRKRWQLRTVARRKTQYTKKKRCIKRDNRQKMQISHVVGVGEHVSRVVAVSATVSVCRNISNTCATFKQ